jgi:Zn-finger nucleic acid-binding protein/ribosomal protein L40E
VRLVACPKCHVQFDVSGVSDPEIACHCGAAIPNGTPQPVEAAIRRCGSCGASVGTQAERCDYCGSGIVRDKSKLSLLCPECYARNGRSSRFCTSCGVEFRPQPPPAAGAAALRCPACKTPKMVKRGIGGVPVEECPYCNGLWVPGANFDALIHRAIDAQKSRPSDGLTTAQPGSAASSPSFPSRVVYRKCPACDGQMQRKNFGARSGVIVDWCGKHGTWLDADELEAIADFIVSGGLEESQGPARTFLPADEKKFEAFITGEKLMAEERMAREKRRRTSEDFKTLGDILETLLGI